MLRHNFKKHKFNAVSTVVDGIRFGSKREANYYRELMLLKKAGEVVGFFMQVPIRLPGGIIYRMDFLVFYEDGTCKGIEVKGYETPEWKIKKKQVAEIHPWIDLEVVK
jgi:hypothetical protein